MSFISIEFAIFFIILFALLLVVKNVKWRKAILLAANCFFYAYWDWRFMVLLVLMTVITYYLSKQILKSKTKQERKLYLTISVIFGLSFLVVFKYLNFFIDSLNLVLNPVGWNLTEIAILLPIGISFYTFEILSYVIDVYRNDVTPAKSLLDFAVLITFFPRLISGPIIRAKNFLPQLERGVEIKFPNLMAGSQTFLQGLIKKTVIADSLAIMVNEVYANPGTYSSATIWLGILAYSVQVFCDFSGYIDMARGVSKVLGFDLPINFNFPFTAQSPTEFWRRWNISLTNWFRDYLYIPLELKRRRVKHFRVETNIMFVFLLTGLWHGASWNFVFWGGLHGLYLILDHWRAHGRPITTPWKTPQSWLRAFLVFVLVTITMVFFRSPSLSITSIVLGKLLILNPGGVDWFYQPAVLFVPLVVVGGWIYRFFEDKAKMPELSYPVQLSLMGLAVLVIFFFAALRTSPFIYFQF